MPMIALKNMSKEVTMNNEDKTQYAGYWIRRFLCEYLVTVRNLSVNTQRSYRDTFKLLLPHLSISLHKSIDRLYLTDISNGRVKGFLDSLESERHCTIQTRNQRLAAVYALAKYVAMHSPEHIEWCRIMRNIPVKKAARKPVTYLEKTEMEMLLEKPDRKTEQGWRDYVLLLFLYNTGARAEEAASLTIGDISIQKGRSGLSIVTITGKGKKSRRCPLWRKTGDVIRSLTKGRMDDEPVFLNRLGQQITRFGVYEMVRRYALALEQQAPELKRKRISPHTIRHTTATHLLQSGVDINTIRAWLGHVSINTTNIYAEINMEMKVKALLTCEVTKDAGSRKHWKEDKNLMSFLDSI